MVESTKPTDTYILRKSTRKDKKEHTAPTRCHRWVKQDIGTRDTYAA